ncbi:hypothetical protein CHIBA101_2197 [Actinomyces sp. Chiba101]|nr:hypothetical protein CHIBA101_2197 [Actinomyces sp. Chiba101]GAV95430.1 hypothetical protein ADENT20671_2217 [Actinomyces denticolens]
MRAPQGRQARGRDDDRQPVGCIGQSAPAEYADGSMIISTVMRSSGAQREAEGALRCRTDDKGSGVRRNGKFYYCDLIP